jgi:hypothetical protein
MAIEPPLSSNLAQFNHNVLESVMDWQEYILVKRIHLLRIVFHLHTFNSVRIEMNSNEQLPYIWQLLYRLQLQIHFPK